MKIHPLSRRLIPSPGLRLLAAAAAILALRASAGAAEGAPPAYNLFEGTSLSVGQKGELHPVWDVEGGEWVVRIAGQPVMVTSKDGPVGMKMSQGLMLTETSATIAGLKADPAYTRANDPYLKFTQGMSKAAADTAGSDSAASASTATMAAAMSQTERTDSSQPSNAPAGSSGSSNSSSEAGIAANAAAAATAQNEAATSVGSVPVVAAGPKTVYDSNGERYDAMDVTFEVSSAKPLEQPYIVLIGQFHDRTAPEGVLQNWIYAQAVERIDSSPKKIHILRGGLPPAFEMKEFQVHLYNFGMEVATNVSPKLQVFTRDEAFDYIKSHYISSHKGATLPAIPALGDLPPDLHQRVTQGQVVQALYVKVSKDGVPTEAYTDKALTQKTDDPYVELILSGIRYKPALENGTPVESVATLNLGQLAM